MVLEMKEDIEIIIKKYGPFIIYVNIYVIVIVKKTILELRSLDFDSFFEEIFLLYYYLLKNI